MSVNTSLQQRETAGNPIRIGMIGAGATGRAIALQLGTPVPGIRLAGIANRTPANAERAFREDGIANWKNTDQRGAAAQSIRRGVPVLTDDAELLVRSPEIDLIVEATGSIDFAAGL